MCSSKYQLKAGSLVTSDTDELAAIHQFLVTESKRCQAEHWIGAGRKRASKLFLPPRRG
jgi:hypothetical protein